MIVSRRLLSLVLSALFLALTVVPVYSQDAVKPPAWVGIYTTAGKVGLKWSPAPGVARYRVYRAITSGKGYELKATTTDVSYIDADVRAGETYYYVLKMVAADGRESGYSEERYIKVPLTGSGAPVKPPEWVGVLIEKKSVKLAWLPSASSNALAYNIYRSPEKDKGFQLIGSTQDPNFTDTDVDEGGTYYYALTTLDREFKETKFGEVREVKVVLQKDVTQPTRPTPKGEEAYVPPEKIIAKPTKIVGFITRGKDDMPLSSPTDVSLAPDGTIVVTDSGTSTIQLFHKGGDFIRAIGGFGQGDGQFMKVLGVFVDGAGVIYAADAYIGKIQKFDMEGHLLMKKNMADDGKEIAKDLGLPKPVTEFGVVKLVVGPDGRMYVLDNYNDCIVMYSANGTFIKAFGGKGTVEGRFQGPTFAAFGREGELYIVDCLNARVQVFNLDGKYLWKFGSYGNIVGTFSRPKGIYVADDGRIYVADSMSNVVQVFDRDGRFLFLLGDERGKQMDLGTPNGIVMDGKRRIYMVEKLVNRVQIRQVGE